MINTGHSGLFVAFDDLSAFDIWCGRLGHGLRSYVDGRVCLIIQLAQQGPWIEMTRNKTLRQFIVTDNRLAHLVASFNVEQTSPRKIIPVVFAHTAESM